MDSNESNGILSSENNNNNNKNKLYSDNDHNNTESNNEQGISCEYKKFITEINSNLSKCKYRRALEEIECKEDLFF